MPTAVTTTLQIEFKIDFTPSLANSLTSFDLEFGFTNNNAYTNHPIYVNIIEKTNVITVDLPPPPPLPPVEEEVIPSVELTPEEVIRIEHFIDQTPKNKNTKYLSGPPSKNLLEIVIYAVIIVAVIGAFSLGCVKLGDALIRLS